MINLRLYYSEIINKTKYNYLVYKKTCKYDSNTTIFANQNEKYSITYRSKPRFISEKS